MLYAIVLGRLLSFLTKTIKIKFAILNNASVTYSFIMTSVFSVSVSAFPQACITSLCKTVAFSQVFFYDENAYQRFLHYIIEKKNSQKY